MQLLTNLRFAGLTEVRYNKKTLGIWLCSKHAPERCEAFTVAVIISLTEPLHNCHHLVISSQPEESFCRLLCCPGRRGSPLGPGRRWHCMSGSRGQRETSGPLCSVVILLIPLSRRIALSNRQVFTSFTPACGCSTRNCSVLLCLGF